MHDRNEDHAEREQPVEAGDRLGPIRKLEGHHIPGTMPARYQCSGEPATHVPHVPDGARERVDPGADPAT